MKALSLLFRTAVTCALLSGVWGCALVQGLREDLDEDAPKNKYLESFDYSAPQNRSLPPPPATVNDDRLTAIAGTPVDLSGMRAKSGRVTKKDFVEEAQKNENSLWDDEGQRNYLFAQNKLKSNGDLITIKIEEELRRDMVLEVKRQLPPEYRDREVFIPGLTVPKKEETDRSVASGVSKAVSASTVEPFDTMTAEVVERYSNGNMRIRGIRKIPFKNKSRNMEVTAIVRNADVDQKDMVESSKFLEHKAELYK